ncbi:hypothetical protein JCM3765_000808, partial [Sporobolomyces pararoseus]
MNVEAVRRLDHEGAFPRTELLRDGFFSSFTASDNDPTEWEIVSFAPTPRMSTYLAAWSNGPFSFVEGGCHSAFDGRWIPMRVYTLPHEIHQARYALETNAKVLPILERFFDIPYPLPKLDTLAVPGFGNGAMENWGLVIGGASIYLMDEGSANIATEKQLVGVASHELAHQWFGNVTTMEWWDEL